MAQKIGLWTTWALRKLWQLTGEEARLWVPVTGSGDQSTLEPGTTTWLDHGTIPVVRVKLTDALGKPPIGESVGDTLKLLTLAQVPSGARLELNDTTWLVGKVSHRGPGGIVHRLDCTLISGSGGR